MAECRTCGLVTAEAAELEALRAAVAGLESHIDMLDKTEDRLLAARDKLHAERESLRAAVERVRAACAATWADPLANPASTATAQRILHALDG